MNRKLVVLSIAVLAGGILAGCQTDDMAGRSDVQVISEAPLPTGPASPDPACSPDNPEC